MLCEQPHNIYVIHRQLENLSHWLASREEGARRLLVRGIIRRERRSRRTARRKGQQTFMRIFYLFNLLTISITTALLAWHIHPRYAAPLLFAYELLIFVFILMRPRRRQWMRSV
jgi:hypothetical protein